MELRLAKTLKKCLDDKRMSLRELARLSGVPASTIGEWAANRSPKNLAHFKKVCEVLGVTIHYLLFGEQDQQDSLQKILKEQLFSGTFEITLKKVKLPGEGK